VRTAQHDASAGGYLSIVHRLLAVKPALALVVDGDQETALVRACGVAAPSRWHVLHAHRHRALSPKAAA
jgi:hypothetical protein